MTTLDPRALKPCPFCNGEVELGDENIFVCSGCGANVSLYSDDIESEWNRLALSQPQAGEPVGWGTYARAICESEGRNWTALDNPREDCERWIKAGQACAALVSPQPANPAQVTDAMVRAAYEDWIADVRDLEPTWSDLPDSYKDSLRGAIAAAIGAGSAEPSLLDRERAAMDVTQRRAIEGERISDAVLAWMVKYDLLDAGNEYHVSDVLAVLDDLAPSDCSAAIGAGGQAVADEVISEVRELDRREAFKAGWWTNAAYDQPSGYLEGCEDTDFAEYKKRGLDAYVTDLLTAAREASDAALSQPHPADERVVEALPEGTLSMHGNDVVLQYAFHEQAQRAFDILEAALSGSGAGGWRLVPVELTYEMVRQLQRGELDGYRAVWPDVLDAATLPAAPTATGGRP